MAAFYAYKFQQIPYGRVIKTINLRNRLEKLEDQYKKKVHAPIIYYHKNVETFEQRKQRFFDEEGYELPDHAKVICCSIVGTK